MSKPLIFFEHPSRVPGTISLATIGQRQANGVRWGFSTKDLANLLSFVCDASVETDTHGEDRVGYWARRWRNEIRAQQAMHDGHAYLDTSGWFGRVDPLFNGPRYIAAASEASSGLTFTPESIVWWNAEGNTQAENKIFARAVWDSGIFGPARLIATGCSNPPRGIDGRTLLVEAQLPNGEITDEIGQATLNRVQRDYAAARATGLYVIAHIDAPDYDAQGVLASERRIQWNKAIVAWLRDPVTYYSSDGTRITKRTELPPPDAWLVFNPAGRLNQPGEPDEVVQMHSDVGAVNAITGGTSNE